MCVSLCVSLCLSVSLCVSLCVSVCLCAQQASVLLLLLSGMSCVVEVRGENQVVALEAQDFTPTQMGNIQVSDLLAGLIPGMLAWSTAPH